MAAYLQLSTYNQSTYVLPRGGCCSGVVVDIGRGSDVESSTSHAESSTSHEWMDVSQSHGHQRTSRWSAAEALAAMMMMVVGVMMMMVVMVMMMMMVVMVMTSLHTVLSSTQAVMSCSSISATQCVAAALRLY